MEFFTDPASLFLFVALAFVVFSVSRLFTKENKKESEKSKKKEGEVAYKNALEQKEKSEVQLDSKNIDEHIEMYLIKTGRINKSMTPSEIFIVTQQFLDETNELSMKKILAEISAEIKQNGTTQIPFDRAMYVLRHYNRRNVISETGKVHIGGIIYKQKNEDDGKDQYISIEESKKRIDFVAEEENNLSNFDFGEEPLEVIKNPERFFENSDRSSVQILLDPKSVFISVNSINYSTFEFTVAS